MMAKICILFFDFRFAIFHHLSLTFQQKQQHQQNAKPCAHKLLFSLANNWVCPRWQLATNCVNQSNSFPLAPRGPSRNRTANCKCGLLSQLQNSNSSGNWLKEFAPLWLGADKIFTHFGRYGLNPRTHSQSMCFPWPGSKCSGPKQSWRPLAAAVNGESVNFICLPNRNSNRNPVHLNMVSWRSRPYWIPSVC